MTHRITKRLITLETAKFLGCAVSWQLYNIAYRWDAPEGKWYLRGMSPSTRRKYGDSWVACDPNSNDPNMYFVPHPDLDGLVVIEFLDEVV